MIQPRSHLAWSSFLKATHEDKHPTVQSHFGAWEPLVSKNCIPSHGISETNLCLQGFWISQDLDKPLPCILCGKDLMIHHQTQGLKSEPVYNEVEDCHLPWLCYSTVDALDWVTLTLLSFSYYFCYYDKKYKIFALTPFLDVQWSGQWGHSFILSCNHYIT